MRINCNFARFRSGLGVFLVPTFCCLLLLGQVSAETLKPVQLQITTAGTSLDIGLDVSTNGDLAKPAVRVASGSQSIIEAINDVPGYITKINPKHGEIDLNTLFVFRDFANSKRVFEEASRAGTTTPGMEAIMSEPSWGRELEDALEIPLDNANRNDILFRRDAAVIKSRMMFPDLKPGEIFSLEQLEQQANLMDLSVEDHTVAYRLDFRSEEQIYRAGGFWPNDSYPGKKPRIAMTLFEHPSTGSPGGANLVSATLDPEWNWYLAERNSELHMKYLAEGTTSSPWPDADVVRRYKIVNYQGVKIEGAIGWEVQNEVIGVGASREQIVAVQEARVRKVGTGMVLEEAWGPWRPTNFGDRFRQDFDIGVQDWINRRGDLELSRTFNELKNSQSVNLKVLDAEHLRELYTNEQLVFSSPNVDRDILEHTSISTDSRLVTDPVQVVRRADGKLLVYDGNHRIFKAINDNVTDLPVPVIEYSDQNAFSRYLTELGQSSDDVFDSPYFTTRPHQVSGSRVSQTSPFRTAVEGRGTAASLLPTAADGFVSRQLNKAGRNVAKAIPLLGIGAAGSSIVYDYSTSKTGLDYTVATANAIVNTIGMFIDPVDLAAAGADVGSIALIGPFIMEYEKYNDYHDKVANFQVVANAKHERIAPIVEELFSRELGIGVPDYAVSGVSNEQRLEAVAALIELGVTPFENSKFGLETTEYLKAGVLSSEQYSVRRLAADLVKSAIPDLTDDQYAEVIRQMGLPHDEIGRLGESFFEGWYNFAGTLLEDTGHLIDDAIKGDRPSYFMPGLDEAQRIIDEGGLPHERIPLFQDLGLNPEEVVNFAGQFRQIHKIIPPSLSPTKAWNDAFANREFNDYDYWENYNSNRALATVTNSHDSYNPIIGSDFLDFAKFDDPIFSNAISNDLGLNAGDYKWGFDSSVIRGFDHERLLYSPSSISLDLDFSSSLPDTLAVDSSGILGGMFRGASTYNWNSSRNDDWLDITRLKSPISIQSVDFSGSTGNSTLDSLIVQSFEYDDSSLDLAYGQGAIHDTNSYLFNYSAQSELLTAGVFAESGLSLDSGGALLGDFYSPGSSIDQASSLVDFGNAIVDFGELDFGPSGVSDAAHSSTGGSSTGVGQPSTGDKPNWAIYYKDKSISGSRDLYKPQMYRPTVARPSMYKPTMSD